MDQNSITWRVRESEHADRSPDWYWTLGIIAIAGILIAIILDNILFAILIGIGAFTLALYASKKPEMVSFEIDHRGIRIDSTLHPFSSLESFWIDELQEDNPKLLLTSRKTLSLQIVIPLYSAPIHEVRSILKERIKEIEQGESIVDRVMELLRL